MIYFLLLCTNILDIKYVDSENRSPVKYTSTVCSDRLLHHSLKLSLKVFTAYNLLSILSKNNIVYANDENQSENSSRYSITYVSHMFIFYVIEAFIIYIIDIVAFHIISYCNIKSAS